MGWLSGEQPIRVSPVDDVAESDLWVTFRAQRVLISTLDLRSCECRVWGNLSLQKDKLGRLPEQQPLEEDHSTIEGESLHEENQ